MHYLGDSFVMNNDGCHSETWKDGVRSFTQGERPLRWFPREHWSRAGWPPLGPLQDSKWASLGPTFWTRMGLLAIWEAQFEKLLPKWAIFHGLCRLSGVEEHGKLKITKVKTPSKSNTICGTFTKISHAPILGFFGKPKWAEAHLRIRRSPFREGRCCLCLWRVPWSDK